MDLARAAVAAAPANPAAHLMLGRSLGGAGELDEAVACLRDACGRFPGDEALHEQLALALARRGEVEAALALARGRQPAPWAALFAFRLLRRHGRDSQAAALEVKAAAAAPADPDLLEARAARLRCDPEALLRLCDCVLAHDPGAAHALHYKAIALAQLGRGAEAVELMALDKYFHRRPLPPPPGPGEAGSEAALRREILANPTLHADPAGHASSGGLRTRIFPNPGDVAAPALIEAIRDSVAAYAQALAGGHPFVRARPERATFTPWALIFRAGGRQILHHHPGRWLTGVYYVGGGEAEAQAGALRIGGLPGWAGVEPPWPLIEIAPVPGTLLLFPSFVPHETLPPGEGSERISIAFDVAAAV